MSVSTESEVNSEEVAKDHQLRSQFMQRLIAAASEFRPVDNGFLPPRLVVQFWDDADNIPLDVQECINSWAELEQTGFKRMLFDDVTAKHFIKNYFDHRHVLAFERCRHPAMRADYFRLCFIFKIGGLWVDADDVYLGHPVEAFVSDGNLKLQPLCYDITNDSMLDPSVSAASEDSSERIYYVNNNPIIAPARHPIIGDALDHATSLLLSANMNSRDIQSLTGPGNLTASLVKHAIGLKRSGAAMDFELLTNWEAIAKSKWPLDYRSDERNWRRWVRGDG